MAQRGPRKVPGRKSLRPRNHGALPRTAAIDERAPRLEGRSSPAPLSALGSTGGGGLSAAERAASERSDAGASEVSRNRSIPVDARSSLTVSPEEPRRGTTESVSTEVEAEAVANLASPAESDGAPPIEHDDPIAAAFFHRPDRPVIDVSDELIIHAMSRSSRRAMWATIGMFSLSLVCIVGYAGYHNIIMPVPAPLGEAADHAILPTPPESATAAAAPTAPTPLRLRASLIDPTRAESERPAQAVSAQGEPARPMAARPEGAPAKVAAHPAPQASAPSAPPAPAAAVVATDRVERAVEATEERVERAVESNDRTEGVVGATERVERAVDSTDGAEGAVGATERAKDAVPSTDRAEGAVGVTSAKAAANGTQPPTHDELLAVGRELSRKNRLSEAVEAFQRALIQTPDSSAALSGLSYVYLNASDLPRARDFAERSVGSDATNSEGWIVLGAARELLGDRSGALAAYRTCVAQGKGRYLSQCRQVAR